MVLGKLAAHGLQSLVALLAITPVFFLPVLLGGVTSAETVRILLALTVTLAVSLAIGMLVSARARHSHSAVLATFTSVAFLALIPWLAGALFHGLHGLTRLSPICVVAAAFDSRYQTRAGASCYWGGLALLVLITAGAIAVARHRLLRDRRSLEEGDTLPPARWPSATHLPRPASRRHGRRFRHPYGVRLVRTFVPARAFRLFCAVALVVLTGAILLSLVRTFRAPYIVTSMCTAYAIHIAVKLAVAFSAARQLHEDRASGALELVLTTPAADRHFLDGVLVAQRTAFRGSVALLAAVNLALALLVHGRAWAGTMGPGDLQAFTTLLLRGPARIPRRPERPRVPGGMAGPACADRGGGGHARHGARPAPLLGGDPPRSPDLESEVRRRDGDAPVDVLHRFHSLPAPAGPVRARTGSRQPP